MGERTDDRRMTTAEALMWQLERDPWLAPSGGSLSLFDRPLDLARLRRALARTVARNERLRQRAVDATTPLTTPQWVVDRELDLDWHVRRVAVPGDGSLRDLLDLTTLLVQDPYDRTRPLWQYIVVDGLADGRGALVVRLHHTVTDGLGAMKLAESYTDLERDAPEPPEVDLDALLRDAPPDPTGLAADARAVATGAARLPLDLARRAVDALTHPDRTGTEARDLVRTTSDQLHGAGSPLWQGRSRRRRLEVLSVPFDDARRAAKALGGTLNHLFLTAAAEAGHRYHHHLGVDLERLHATFVVSTRTDDAAHNAFTPVPVELPAGPMALDHRFADVARRVQARRAEVHGAGPMATVAPLATLLPTPFVAGIVRNQAAHVDLATSNIAGYPGETFVAGAKTEHVYPIGPLAGTACNLTMFSTNEFLDVSLHADPVAIADPGLLRRCLESSFADLLA